MSVHREIKVGNQSLRRRDRPAPHRIPKGRRLAWTSPELLRHLGTVLDLREDGRSARRTTRTRVAVSRELDRLESVRSALAVYRLAFGQARQDDLVAISSHVSGRPSPSTSGSIQNCPPPTSPRLIPSAELRANNLAFTKPHLGPSAAADERELANLKSGGHTESLPRRPRFGGRGASGRAARGSLSRLPCRSCSRRRLVRYRRGRRGRLCLDAPRVRRKLGCRLREVPFMSTTDATGKEQSARRSRTAVEVDPLAGVGVRPFATGFQSVGSLVTARRAILRIPSDLAPQPWHVQIVPTASVTACKPSLPW